MARRPQYPISVECSGDVARRLWPMEASAPAARAAPGVWPKRGALYMVVIPDDQPAFATPLLSEPA